MKDNNTAARAALYEYEKTECLHAAMEYAETCVRVGALFNRMDIINYCARTMPDMKVSDAVEIAAAVRGVYIRVRPEG